MSASWISNSSQAALLSAFFGALAQAPFIGLFIGSPSAGSHLLYRASR